ncbi:MAG: hypothetical protein N2249_05800 [Melioribacter sp.]|nr:hypothetical protein [Melioribacter sp.]
MLINKKIIIFSFIFFSSQFAQLNNFNAGLYLGLGEIKGNSSPVTSLGISVFTDFNLWFSEEVKFRTGFNYVKKLEYFIPESRVGRYYSFIKLFFIKSILEQKLYKIFYLEEGIGLIYINDRTVSDINNWQPGISFNLTTGIDFCEINNNKVRLGFGIDYGLGITKTTVSYYLVYLCAMLKI